MGSGASLPDRDPMLTNGTCQDPISNQGHFLRLQEGRVLGEVPLPAGLHVHSGFPGPCLHTLPQTPLLGRHSRASQLCHRRAESSSQPRTENFRRCEGPIPWGQGHGRVFPAGVWFQPCPFHWAPPPPMQTTHPRPRGLQRAGPSPVALVALLCDSGERWGSTCSCSSTKLCPPPSWCPRGKVAGWSSRPRPSWAPLQLRAAPGPAPLWRQTGRGQGTSRVQDGESRAGEKGQTRTGGIA